MQSAAFYICLIEMTQKPPQNHFVFKIEGTTVGGWGGSTASLNYFRSVAHQENS